MKLTGDKTYQINKKYDLVMTTETGELLNYITEKYSEEIQWFCELEVKETERKIYIRNIHFPEQESTVTTVKSSVEQMSKMYDETPDWKNYFLWGHSHHSMAANPSGQDIKTVEEYLDSGMPFIVMMITSRQGSRITYCAKEFKYDMEVIYTYPEKIGELYKEAIAKVKKPVYTYYGGGSYGYNSYKNTPQTQTKETTSGYHPMHLIRTALIEQLVDKLKIEKFKLSAEPLWKIIDMAIDNDCDIFKIGEAIDTLSDKAQKKRLKNRLKRKNGFSIKEWMETVTFEDSPNGRLAEKEVRAVIASGIPEDILNILNDYDIIDLAVLTHYLPKVKDTAEKASWMPVYNAMLNGAETSEKTGEELTEEYIAEETLKILEERKASIFTINTCKGQIMSGNPIQAISCLFRNDIQNADWWEFFLNKMNDSQAKDYWILELNKVKRKVKDVASLFYCDEKDWWRVERSYNDYLKGNSPIPLLKDIDSIGGLNSEILEALIPDIISPDLQQEYLDKLKALKDEKVVDAPPADKLPLDRESICEYLEGLFMEGKLDTHLDYSAVEAMKHFIRTGTPNEAIRTLACIELRWGDENELLECIEFFKNELDSSIKEEQVQELYYIRDVTDVIQFLNDLYYDDKEDKYTLEEYGSWKTIIRTDNTENSIKLLESLQIEDAGMNQQKEEIIAYYRTRHLVGTQAQDSEEVV